MASSKRKIQATIQIKDGDIEVESMVDENGKPIFGELNRLIALRDTVNHYLEKDYERSPERRK